jgi:hypothetical protein
VTSALRGGGTARRRLAALIGGLLCPVGETITVASTSGRMARQTSTGWWPVRVSASPAPTRFRLGYDARAEDALPALAAGDAEDYPSGVV